MIFARRSYPGRVQPALTRARKMDLIFFGCFDLLAVNRTKASHADRDSNADRICFLRGQEVKSRDQTIEIITMPSSNDSMAFKDRLKRIPLLETLVKQLRTRTIKAPEIERYLEDLKDLKDLR